MQGLETYLLRELSILRKLRDGDQQYFVTFVGAHNGTATAADVAASSSSTENNRQTNASDDDGDDINWKDHQEKTENGKYVLYIITEYCQGGDLLSLLLENGSKSLSWKFRLKLALDAALAKHHLHAKNFIHRDIKSENFLIDKNYRCKLTDFGLSREVADPLTPNRMTICGTKEYTAPEMHFDSEYTSAVDIFSYGMVLVEVRSAHCNFCFCVVTTRRLTCRCAIRSCYVGEWVRQISSDGSHKLSNDRRT
jgi:serine/threonine protein kinase